MFKTAHGSAVNDGAADGIKEIAQGKHGTREEQRSSYAACRQKNDGRLFFLCFLVL